MTVIKSFPRVIATAGIAGAFVVGLLAAKVGGRAPANDPEQKSKTRSSQIASLRSSPKTIEGKSWQVAKEQLIRRWETSPAAYSDFPLHEESYALLEKVAVADLETWLLDINTELNDIDECEYKRDMQKMVFRVLAHRSPEHLIQFLSSHQTEAWELENEDVMDIWIEHDPVAALAWLDKGNLPEDLREDSEDYLEDAIVKLAVKDPAGFEKRLARVSQESRESILHDYAFRAGTALGRAALLERASQSEHAEAMALWKGLLRREGENQPEKAYATLQQLDVSDADRVMLDLDLLKWILPNNPSSRDTGAEAMRKWLERNPAQSVPAILLETYMRWFSSDSQGAGDWIINQLPEARYDTFARLAIEQRVTEEKDNFPLFAKLAGRITNSATRWESQRLLKKSWQSKDPVAASEWEMKLPIPDQEKLNLHE